MTQRSLLLSAAIAMGLGGAAVAQTTSAPTGSEASSPSATAPGTTQTLPVEGANYSVRAVDAPLSRAEVQAEGTAVMHAGGAAGGEALATRNRPHGGPMNADAPSTGAGAGHTNGPGNWSNGYSGDGG